MADLYTSLVRAKQELNGGVLPAMTPVPENVQHFIDPAFTPGLGALEEHPEKGLRCPVRGCGRFLHLLTPHLNKVHEDIGGAERVVAALSLPPIGGRNRLVSRAYSSRRSRIARDMSIGGRLRQQQSAISVEERQRRARLGGRRGGRASGRSRRSVALKNLGNKCEAQMVQRLLSIRDKIGRVPSKREVIALEGQVLYHHAVNLYGSWNAFVEFAGERARVANHDKFNRRSVLASLSEWHRIHGTLPTWTQAKRPDRTPVLPSVAAVCRHMGTTSWPEAMRRAATVLGIYGGRYGMPVRDSHSEAAD